MAPMLSCAECLQRHSKDALAIGEGRLSQPIACARRNMFEKENMLPARPVMKGPSRYRATHD